MTAAPVLRVSIAVLAEDLVPGDRITDAGLGGSFDAEVESVRVGPDKYVYVDLVDDYGKAQRFSFTRTEMMGVLRARR
jgi:hypothetical protein